jgi:hypothetical protein
MWPSKSVKNRSMWPSTSVECVFPSEACLATFDAKAHICTSMYRYSGRLVFEPPASLYGNPKHSSVQISLSTPPNLLRISSSVYRTDELSLSPIPAGPRTYAGFLLQPNFLSFSPTLSLFGWILISFLVYTVALPSPVPQSRLVSTTIIDVAPDPVLDAKPGPPALTPRPRLVTALAWTPTPCMSPPPWWPPDAAPLIVSRWMLPAASPWLPRPPTATGKEEGERRKKKKKK